MPESFLPVIVGSFSTPAADNPTSAVVEASFRATGFFGRYVNCEVAPEMLGDAVRGARAQGWRGFNCSLPHKVSVLAYLDELTPEAAAIGAVNCVTLDPAGRMVGDNTDGRGFLRALRETVDPSGADVVVIGAGGAARAVCVELALAGASRVTVVNRSKDRALGVVAAVTACSAASAAYEPLTPGFEIPASADIVVNATSIGLAPADQEIPPVSLELLGSDECGRRPDPESAHDPVPACGRRPWAADHRRQGHVGESGCHQRRVVDGCAGGSRRHASRAGRSHPIGKAQPDAGPTPYTNIRELRHSTPRNRARTSWRTGSTCGGLLFGWASGMAVFGFVGLVGCGRVPGRPALPGRG